MAVLGELVLREVVLLERDAAGVGGGMSWSSASFRRWGGGWLRVAGLLVLNLIPRRDEAEDLETPKKTCAQKIVHSFKPQNSITLVVLVGDGDSCARGSQPIGAR